MKNRPAKPLSLLSLLLLVLMGAGACSRTAKTLLPASYRDTVLLPATEQPFGNAYAYEHKIRGDLFMSRQRPNQAVQEYEAAVVGAPDDASLHLQLADALIAIGRLEKARLHIAKAILLSPGDGLAWRTAAVLHMKENRPKDAVEAAIKGYTADRADVSSLLWLAQYYQQKKGRGPQVRALHYYQLALVRCHTRSDLFFAAAMLSHKLQYHDSAVHYFQQYLALFGDDHHAVAQVAADYERNGRPDAAVALYKTMLVQKPQSDALRRNLILLYLKMNLHREAVRQIFSMQEFPSSPRQLVERTDWLLRAAAPWEARTMIIENFSGNPLHPAVRLQLAKVELTLQRTEVALLLLTHPNGTWPETYRNKVQTLRKQAESE